MYAVVESGGKQYRVAEGDVIHVERLASATGEQITLDRVLLVVNGSEVQVGAPLVEGASVNAEVLDPMASGPKVLIFKYRRRKRYRRKTGHRQKYSALKVTKIAHTS